MKQLTVYEITINDEANEATYSLRNEEWWETKQMNQLTLYEMKSGERLRNETTYILRNEEWETT